MMRSRKPGRLPRKATLPRALRLSRPLAWLALCITLALGGRFAMAGPEREPNRNNFAPRPGLSLDQANHLLRGRIDGRAVAVVPLDGGRRGYQVRVLLDGGRIATIRMDRNGRILSAAGQLPFD